jgi:hypothetical protein
MGHGFPIGQQLIPTRQNAPRLQDFPEPHDQDPQPGGPEKKTAITSLDHSLICHLLRKVSNKNCSFFIFVIVDKSPARP